MLIDTHAHINFSAFREDAEATILRALGNGVWIINVGTQLDTSKEAVKVAEMYDQGIYAVIGLHPVHTYSQELDEEESSFTSRQEKFDPFQYEVLARSEKVIGIGECGLDYYRLPAETENGSNIEQIKQMQKEAFVLQIKLAKKLNKALVIHGRPSKDTQDAYEDILKILDQEGSGSLKFEIHSFTGNKEVVLKFLARGAYVGLNGIITFDKTGNMEQVVRSIPLERIVLETDSPYLTPVPNRGKRNEPSFVQYVAKKVAELKDLSSEEVAHVTSQNAKVLFNLL